MSQFKVITNKELPKVSDPSRSFIGRYKKEKNQTKFKWIFQKDEEDAANEPKKTEREESKDLDTM